MPPTTQEVEPVSAPAHAFRPQINVDPEPIDEVIVMAARDLVRATAYLSDVITVEAEVPA